MGAFKKISLGTNMGAMTFYRLTGLPDGESCVLSPEDAARPSGEWYAAVKRGGKKRTIHCGSLDEAKKAAVAWATEPRPRKRAGVKK